MAGLCSQPQWAVQPGRAWTGPDRSEVPLFLVRMVWRRGAEWSRGRREQVAVPACERALGWRAQGSISAARPAKSNHALAGGRDRCHARPRSRCWTIGWSAIAEMGIGTRSWRGCPSARDDHHVRRRRHSRHTAWRVRRKARRETAAVTKRVGAGIGRAMRSFLGCL